jgi:hypothetical protein
MVEMVDNRDSVAAEMTRIAGMPGQIDGLVSLCDPHLACYLLNISHIYFTEGRIKIV